MHTQNYRISRVDDPITLQQLTQIFARVFDLSTAVEVEHSHLEELCKKECFFALGAFYNKQIIGGLTGYLLPCYFNKSFSFYLYDLAVLPSFQRKGVGKRLIHHIKTYCEKKGVNELFVQAHKEASTLYFYQSTLPDRTEEVMLYSYACSPSFDL